VILYYEDANWRQNGSFPFVFEARESYSQRLLIRMPVLYIYSSCDDHVQISLGGRKDRQA